MTTGNKRENGRIRFNRARHREREDSGKGGVIGILDCLLVFGRRSSEDGSKVERNTTDE